MRLADPRLEPRLIETAAVSRLKALTLARGDQFMNETKRSIQVTILAVSLLFAASFVDAQSTSDLGLYFTKQEVLIPMRDGVRLHTEIYAPKESNRPLPILFTRTPYGMGYDENGFHISLSTSYLELAESGYIFVFQDIRGRYGSEGEFVMIRPPRNENQNETIDEGTDTYDTIEWLLDNVDNHNGRVGILGISYGGWLTIMAMIEPHPAVKAVSPQASPSDMFIGDDFLHNGALRLGPAFGYASMMERSNEVMPFRFRPYDTYEWYLELGPLANANEEYLNGKAPTWNAIMEHSSYDAYWKRLEVTQYLKKVSVPTLNVAGWWDAEDFYGPMKIYQTLEQYDTENQNYLVVGPWRHGGWARSSGDRLGKIQFGTATSDFFRQRIQTRWFAHFLKDRGDLDFPEAMAFQTGSNRWRRYENWPPQKGISKKNLYFHADGRLSFAPPTTTSEEAFDTYVSDPAHPVPYQPRPIPGFWQGASALWKVEDQRFVHLRPDVLSWETDVLEEDVTVSGRTVVHLFASTTGTDSDWVAKLIDVYPEYIPDPPEMSGYQLMIADEVLRAKFRNAFEKPEPVPTGDVVEYTIDLHSHNHTFLKGHRIMVQVQSSWFPLIDRNPQTFVERAKATEADYRKATQRVYWSKAHSSHVVLPVEVER
jgi:putative CocE/NonD family hydrolase